MSIKLNNLSTSEDLKKTITDGSATIEGIKEYLQTTEDPNDPQLLKLVSEDFKEQLTELYSFRSGEYNFALAALASNENLDEETMLKISDFSDVHAKLSLLDNKRLTFKVFKKMLQDYKRLSDDEINNNTDYSNYDSYLCSKLIDYAALGSQKVLDNHEPVSRSYEIQTVELTNEDFAEIYNMEYGNKILTCRALYKNMKVPAYIRICCGFRNAKFSRIHKKMGITILEMLKSVFTGIAFSEDIFDEEMAEKIFYLLQKLHLYFKDELEAEAYKESFIDFLLGRSIDEDTESKLNSCFSTENRWSTQ